MGYISLANVIQRSECIERSVNGLTHMNIVTLCLGKGVKWKMPNRLFPKIL